MAVRISYEYPARMRRVYVLQPVRAGSLKSGRTAADCPLSRWKVRRGGEKLMAYLLLGAAIVLEAS